MNRAKAATDPENAGPNRRRDLGLPLLKERHRSRPVDAPKLRLQLGDVDERDIDVDQPLLAPLDPLGEPLEEDRC